TTRGAFTTFDQRPAARDVVATHRISTARAVRRGHLSSERTRRAEAQQDQFRGPAPAPPYRADRHRGREPVAAREQGQGAQAAPARAVPRTPRPTAYRTHRRGGRGASRLRRRARPRPPPHERQRPAV